VRHLRRPLLQRRVDEHAVRVLVPLGLEAGLDVLELHLLDHEWIKHAGVSRVVVQNCAVPVFLGGPEVIPFGPDAVGAEVDGEEAMEVRQPLFGEKIERQRDAGRIAYSSGALSQRLQMMIGIFSRRRLQQLRGEPEHPLRFVRRHQLNNQGLQIGEHLDLRQRFFFYWIHSRPRTGLTTWRQPAASSGE
jgi:hypothetical protein